MNIGELLVAGFNQNRRDCKKQNEAEEGEDQISLLLTTKQMCEIDVGKCIAETACANS